GSSDATFSVELKCVQALGSEIYVGCSNGDVLLFSLQSNGPHQVCSRRLYAPLLTILMTRSRNRINFSPDNRYRLGKAVDEIVL
ncbi:hypothetical protein BC826DRAFT_1044128, partial [Russula brevipes]